jgi:hypothetical protein
MISGTVPIWSFGSFGYSTFFPDTKEMMKMIKNTKNRIFAMPVAAPAMPPNPRNPAINATTKNIKEYLNI